MGLLKRIFGICSTKPPADEGGWSYADGRIDVHLDRIPELSAKGGAVRLEGKGLPERILILRGKDHQYHVFRNKCTHMGRRIDPLEGTENVRCCSVSKSTFTYSGEMISGPAKGPLETYRAAVENGILVISMR